ncbi:M28 family peptidase [Mucilaginibacter sp. BJC16-A38]|uniref:M28 family peptidase n=1 Tax=Mucilaginibacter phenanthrenivorans TaxID=1234842 RepID=UPI0021578990|nr:M28 family peptidase [Mucilaginibacter phenanthrenivorans]MCR8559013.1 M28 family peptidase [Mucilaginibacter phenanthrenivorans]
MIRIKPAKTLLFAALTLLSCSGFAQVKLSPEVEASLSKVDTAQFKADIAYLADDKLKGRGPGTEGYQMAVDYVVSRLKGVGVKPAGENGTWLQEVKFRKAFLKDATVSITGTNPALKIGVDYTVFPNPSIANVTVNGQLAFAGYGTSEPSVGYDDYAGLDVKGKIVLVVRGAPDKFSSSVSAHTMSPSTILKSAADHGAVGVIICSTDSTAKMRNTKGGSYSVIGRDGKVAISGIYYSDQVKVLGMFSYSVFNTLLQQSGKTMPALLAQLKGGTPASFTINSTANIAYTSTYQDILSYNVIGKIEGSDPKLKNEYIVHSAHLDHLGIGKPVEGDSIYNGAHDNASGVASVLAIAKIYQGIKQKPKRSILTVLLTGEELGDLGSGYFASHPTVPVKSIVADVNTDMPTIIAPLLSVTALGAEHSSLSKQVDEAAGYLGLGVEPDPEPKQARFTRSDQYSFVVNGIPALHIKYGSKTADGKNNLNEFVAKWRAKYYHKPQDDINGIFDFAAGKKYAQLNFIIGYLVAQDEARPTWNPGDIFASK